jgi:hypothetical protein
LVLSSLEIEIKLIGLSTKSSLSCLFFNNKEAKEALNRLETVQVFKGLKNYVFLQENIPLQEALDIRKRILIDKDTNFIRNFKSKCRSNELEMIFIQ